jgi:hypothetical protein
MAQVPRMRQSGTPKVSHGFSEVPANGEIMEAAGIEPALDFTGNVDLCREICEAWLRGEPVLGSVGDEMDLIARAYLDKTK